MDEEANNRSLCKKQKGGIHGLVIGDVFRRLVARSLAQLYATQIQAACRPWQFALPTRVGTEAVIKALATSTELDHQQTILYVDGGWGVARAGTNGVESTRKKMPSLLPRNEMAAMAST